MAKAEGNDPVGTDEVPAVTNGPNKEAREKVVNDYVIWSVGAGFIPFPVLDIAALITVQLKMLNDLSKIYKIKFSDKIGQPIAGALLGFVVPKAAGMGIGSVLKMVPVVGTVLGAVTFPALAGASTYALGRVFIQHYESGGTLLDFDPEKMKAAYLDAYGKKPK